MLLLVAALIGCGEEERVPPQGDDLLGRGPDAVLEQPGTLRPDPREQWGPWGRHGWEGYTYSFDGGRWQAVWMRRTRAGLNLPAVEAISRELRLTLRGPRGKAADPTPLRARLRLNGVEVLTFEAPGEFTEITVPTPAQGWRVGDNGLEIEVDRLEPDEDGRLVGLALARLDYDRTLVPAVSPSEGRLVLQHGTGVSYRFEDLGPSRLHLSCAAQGPGGLSVVWRHVEPRRGEVISEGERLELELGSAGLERLFALPATAGELLELSLSWTARDERAPLTFSTLARVEEAPAERPPIIFVCVDTLAAKNLSLYGYRRDTTPYLRSLAEEAVVFERCLTNSPWTMPSVFSTMTGLYPGAHQLEDEPDATVGREAWEQWYLSQNRWTLAECLRAAGYRTAGFVEHLWLTPRYGFPQGFDRYDFSACEFEAVDPRGGTRYVAGKALAWIDGLPPRAPFFLFLHTFDVHGPYSPEPPWKGRFHGDELFREGKELPAGGMYNTYGAVPGYVVEAEYPGSVPATVDGGRVRAAYDEGVAMVDGLLEEFLAGLRSRGILDRALLVVTADHGETMDRGPYFFGHGVLEEEVLHVPLLVRFPRSVHAGLRVEDTVQLVDLYPTLVDLVGVDPARRWLHGRSLLPLLRGVALPERAAFAEGGIHRQVTVELNGWRLVVRSPAERSADQVLLSDPSVPREWLAESFPGLDRSVLTSELFERLRAGEDFSARMADLRERMSAVDERLSRLAQDGSGEVDFSTTRAKKLERLKELLGRCTALQRESRADAHPPTDLVDLPPEQVEQLRKLGYAGRD